MSYVGSEASPHPCAGRNHERRALERRQRILARSRASRAAEAEEGQAGQSAAEDVVNGDTARGGSNRTAAEQRQAAALLAYMTNAMHYMLKVCVATRQGLGSWDDVELLHLTALLAQANESSDAARRGSAGSARNASAASVSPALGLALGSCLQPTAALPSHISKAAQRAMDFNDALWEVSELHDAPPCNKPRPPL